MVKIFRGGYGYSSCIINDNLYNFFNQNTQSILVWRDTDYTDLGRVMLAAAGVDFNGFYCTVLQSILQDQINMATAMNLLHHIFPQANYATISDAPTSDFSTTQFQGTSYFAVKQLQNSVQPRDSSVVCWYRDSGGGSRFGDNQGCSPFGYVGSQSLYQSFVVFKSDLSTFYLIRINIGYTGLHPEISTYRLIPGISVGSVLQMTTWYNLIDLYGTDPYSPGGITDPTPPLPTGDFDNTSDPIDIDQLPSLSAVNTRFITLFNPTLGLLQDFASYLWGTSFNLDQFKKLFTDPMGAILGLSIVPVQPSVDTATAVTLGNIQTPIYMPKISNQYVQVQCGVLNVHEYWGAYLDYSPYTKLEIYLPYIGIQTLDADDVMSKSITLAYNIDVLTGACVAQLKCGDSVLYTFSGSCATSIPITGRDWTNVVNGIIGIGSSLASFGINVAGGNVGGAVSTAASAVQNVFETKPGIKKSGSMGSMPGMLGHQKPYLILTRPRQALPDEQNTFTGYPSFITETLGNLTGYTIVDRIHLSGFYALDDELSEIETLLKSGVIL